MSRRGFSGRGSSFRGRGDWSDSSSRGRGFSGPSRGRFNWYKESSFDSRRYGGSERYSSRGRGDDGSYRRYSRMDGPAYSPRDHRDHRSPESQRKRLRTDHGYVQGSSSRRSHEGSYGGGSDYNNRYSYSEEKGSYGDERGRAYREERRSGSGFRDRSREEYAHRKADQLDSGMPPPSAPSRHLSSPRGSFRGRIRGRGVSRMIFSRRADSMLVRKKIMDSSYSFRKRMLASRAAENLRILKLQRLRRLRAAAKTKKDADKDGSKATEDISEEEKEENWEEEGEKVEDDDELEEGETPDKKEKVKAKKEKKEAAESKKDKDKDEEREEGEEVDDEEEEDDEEEADSGTSTPKKSEAKNEGGVHVTIKQDSDARAVSEEGRKRTSRTLSGRPYIRLTCPHCYVRCVTFKEYTMHLYTSKHINMMRKQSLRHKQTLARMRMNQRHKQRILEENEEAHGSLAPRSSFCPICKLNYRQLKSKHQVSETHRAMKKFLMPYCRVCRVGFKSPMLYENHICSLDHLKRKARLEERMMHERDRDSDGGSGEDEDKEINMDNFMILDSVGTVDDSGEEGEGEEGKSKSDKEKEEGKEKSKTEIKLGSEYIKKVEVYFCDLCRLYLPRLDPPERALSIHCRTRNHLQRYVRYRDDRALRSKAEKIHHRREKENAAKEAESKKNAEDKKEETEKKESEGTDDKDGDAKGAAAASECNKKNSLAEDGAKTSQQEGHDTSTETIGDGGGEGDGDLDQDLEGGMDDKLWADVDKDLGELLREVEPGNKSSDEDEDSRAEGGRYDRFRYSEKGNLVGDASAEGDAAESNAKPNANGEAEKSEVSNSKETAGTKQTGDDSPKKQAATNAAASSPPSAAASS